MIKVRFSLGVPPGRRRPSHPDRREKAIWQRRYWGHHIRDGADLAGHVARCWADPVRHGLVGRPEDWPFSSIRRDRGRGRIDP